MLTRRDTLLGALALGACAPPPPAPPYYPLPDGDMPRVPATDPRILEMEARIGGRIGVAAQDTANGAWLIEHRARERFAMCSTFKWMLAAQVLYLDMHVPSFREQRLAFGERDLLEYAPTARRLLARGWMTVEEACEGAVSISDNTCANLLLARAGGPDGLTNFLRANGDAVTRLDRTEPELNVVPPGDERDTSTPEAMVRTLQRFLLTDEVLNPAPRNRIINWMVASPTGRERLRAGFLGDWRVGDKTGTWTGEHNATNDVAIAWPPNRPPIVIAAYISRSTAEFPERNAAHAEIARIVAQEWG